MKYLFAFLLPVVVLFSGCGSSSNQQGDGQSADTLKLSGMLKISASETMYPMMDRWRNEFIKLHPAVKFDIKPKHSAEALSDLLNGKADLAMMSVKPSDTAIKQGLWVAAVAMDALVPIINFDNPEIQPLVMHGITKEKLMQAFTGKIRTWGQISGRSGKAPVRVYTMSDSSGTAAVWYQFLGIERTNVKAERVYNAKEMLEKITAEPGAIGYCSIMDAYNQETGFRKDGLYILPVDYNDSKTIEDKEQFYDKYSLASNAVVTGKMPSPPARNLYLVTKGKPQGNLMKGFIQWVLTIGQNYMPAEGYLNITPQSANTTIESMK